MDRQKLVIVGGASRAGSNSISTYLHLHDEIAMFHSGVPLRSMIDLPAWTSDLAFLQKVFNNNKKTNKYQEFLDYVDDKNARLSIFLPKLTYIGRRYDYAEEDHDLLRHILRKFEVRYIYCMRKDIEALFTSQLSMGYTRTLEQFTARQTRSFQSARKLKKDGFNVCAIDITQFKKDFSRLDEFMCIDPSPLQQKWKELNPVTNSLGLRRSKNKHDKSAFKSLNKLYKLTRMELNV